MGMVVRTNTMAMNAQRQLGMNNNAVSKSLEKLSSGFRINRAADDASGLAISEKMKAQIKGLEQASSNSQDGISLIQTAEGATTEIHNMLNRMVELATKSANGTIQNEVDREAIQTEVDALNSEITRISMSTNFNGINLLDGSLGAKALDSYFGSSGTNNLVDGVIVNAPVDGAGKKDEFSLDFKGTFGAGDTITYKANFTDAAGNQISKNITLTYDAAAVTADADTAATDGKFGGATKEEQMQSIAKALGEVKVGGSGTDAGDKLFAKFDIAVVPNDTTAPDGTVTHDFKINLTAKDEGVSNVQLSTATGSTAVVDKSIIAKSDVTTTGTHNTTPATTTAKGGYNDLLSSTADLKVGDTLTFKANVQGKNMTLTLKVGDAADTANGVFAIGTSVKETTKNLVDALKAASFDDDIATGIDESQFKASEYFTITENLQMDGTTASDGSISIVAKTGDGIKADTNSFGYDATADAAGLSIKRNNVEIKKANSIAGAGTAANGGTATPQVSTMKFTNSFMDGDSVTIRGILSDGQSFEATLTAGKDFAIGATLDATMTNLTAALNGGNGTDGVSKVMAKVTQGDGSIKDVEAGKIFDGKDFTVASTGGGSGEITLTSTVAGVTGKGIAGSISSASTTVDPNNKVTDATVTQDVVGKAQSNALNTITFDPSKIEQGTKLTIGGKTFEFVTSEDFLTNENNKAVVVNNLNKRNADGTLANDAATGEDIAKAVVNALNNKVDGSGHSVAPGVDSSSNAYKGEFTYTDADGSTTKYDLLVDPNSSSLQIVSQNTGTDAVALQDIAMASDKQNTTNIVFGETTTGAGSATKTTPNVKVGDTITVDGKTYEFTDGEHRTKTEGNIAVSLKGADTAEKAAKALADAINADTKAHVADGKPGGVIASVTTIANKDGSRSFAVSLTSKYNDTKGDGHEYDAPVVDIPKGGTGLTLQIGDTNDDFNRVSVSVDDLSAKGIGTDKVDVSTQDAAGAAIDTIKAAINQVSTNRANLGALQNRLEYTISNLDTTAENMTSANSRIRDTDMAKEMMNYTKMNVLTQAAQAMLAQANQQPQSILQLLQ